MSLSSKITKTQAETCIAVLQKVYAAVKQTPADLFLAGYFRENRQFGSRDRKLITETVFAVFRWNGWLRKAGWFDRPLVWHILFAFAAEGILPDGVYVHWCESAGYSPGQYEKLFLLQTSADRLSVLTGKSGQFLPEDLVPQWAAEAVKEEYRERFFRSLQTRPPLWLRLYDMKYTKIVCAELKKFYPNAALSFHPRIPEALSVQNVRVDLKSLPCGKKGLLEVQDFSSQCIGLAAMPKTGENWFDICAGGGGKTIFLASKMKNTGSVTASDIREFKLKEVMKRAERAGLKNVYTIPYSPKFDPTMTGRFDGVFADVPCSSSGRWRRNPESRFNLTRKDVSEIVQLQRKILLKASQMVKQGGVLIYGTCSVFQCENEDNILWFLQNNPHFQAEGFVNPHTGEMTDGKLQTLPDDANCDGSFAARFRRIS